MPVKCRWKEGYEDGVGQQRKLQEKKRVAAKEIAQQINGEVYTKLKSLVGKLK